MKINAQIVALAVVILFVIVKAAIWLFANLLPIFFFLLILAGVVLVFWLIMSKKAPFLLIGLLVVYFALFVRGIIWVVVNGHYALDLFLYMVIASILAVVAFAAVMYWKKGDASDVEYAALAAGIVFALVLFYGGRSASFHQQIRMLEESFRATAFSGPHSVDYRSHALDYYGNLDEIVAARNKLAHDYGYKQYGKWWVDDYGTHTKMSFSFPSWMFPGY